MTEIMARLAACERENVELKQRLAERDAEVARLSVLDPYYALKLDLPTPDQALVLWRKITAKYPLMISPTDSVTDQVMGLTAAMGFCFSVAKSERPVSRHEAPHWIRAAEAFARDARLPAPRIRSVVLGIIATNDVPFGIIATTNVLSASDIFLDTFGHGGKPVDRTAWRKLLDGAPLREPTVINKRPLDESIGPVRRSGVW